MIEWNSEENGTKFNKQTQKYDFFSLLKSFHVSCRHLNVRVFMSHVNKSWWTNAHGHERQRNRPTKLIFWNPLQNSLNGSFNHVDTHGGLDLPWTWTVVIVYLTPTGCCQNTSWTPGLLVLLHLNPFFHVSLCVHFFRIVRTWNKNNFTTHIFLHEVHIITLLWFKKITLLCTRTCWNTNGSCLGARFDLKIVFIMNR